MIQLYDRFSLLINWYCSPINEHDMKKSKRMKRNNYDLDSNQNLTKPKKENHK